MGAGGSLLTDEQMKKLKQTTPYNEQEIKRLLKRYATYDNSPGGTAGIKQEEILLFPEFAGNPLIPRVLDLYLNSESGRIFPDKFLYFCAILSSRTGIGAKRQMAFRCFDVHNEGCLQYDELFKMYKSLFGMALPDDTILNLVFTALHESNLETPGMITPEDFTRMVPDHEIAMRFTVDLQLP
ncbi:hypothetical protein CAPTEDRAFT_165784 [Capitella teleta]|uniref:EF-hand domain-containing protein n=1 Tax=Capitella teleta TaxID=283909 RepID=R7VC60_CAPTE|nr:hypothetical protein CAPTEDRAFT_165784 [Capitella teleta]|eukprot:ELU13260.1 hypothetical protein CAPTEDRAFT_165784 [Capitella teleta]